VVSGLSAFRMGKSWPGLAVHPERLEPSATTLPVWNSLSRLGDRLDPVVDSVLVAHRGGRVGVPERGID
jgi:hypothetical protein